MTNMTREEWLDGYATLLRPAFEEAGHPLPERVRLSIGFPPKGGFVKKTLGFCCAKSMADDEVCQIYLSPLLEPHEFGHVLVHELLHAALGHEAGHGRTFAKAAAKLGLEGKPTHTVAGLDLAGRLLTLEKPLGPCPHVAIKPLPAKEKKKRGTKAYCSCADPRELALSKKLLEGPPIQCNGCNRLFVPDEDGAEAGEEPAESAA